MNPVSKRQGGADILYDADFIGQIEPALFDPEQLHARGALIGQARGRGAAWFFRYEGCELVLRHYRRGGVLGPWLGDRYLWLGRARARAMREWHLLADLHARGLPVPRAVAARVHRSGLIYRADLVTERIAAAASLAQSLARAPLSSARWRDVGACIARFHAAGVWHADLNAHNILLTDDRVYLIDFDRGRFRPLGQWTAANLARLRRSLDKLRRTEPVCHFDEESWRAFVAGYGDNALGARAGQSSTKAAT